MPTETINEKKPLKMRFPMMELEINRSSPGFEPTEEAAQTGNS